MATVSFDHVNKVYPSKQGPVYAVRDMHIDIADRELLVFVGPSGCGKTTSLRMIAGLEEITKGTIKIGDRVVNNVPPKNRDIAMVFQNYALYPHMSVYDNMAFGLRMRRVPRAEIKQKVHEAAHQLGIEHLLKRKPKALSGGERQRVAVGRAIVRHPQVFLFDEPLSNLDAKLRVQMRTEIKRLQRELGTTTVYVTHDQEEAMTLADRLVVMRKGVMHQCGTPLDIYSKPADRFVAGFFGTPCMNFLSGRLIEADGQACFAGGGIVAPLPEVLAGEASRLGLADVILGVRAEHVLLNGRAGRFSSAGGSAAPDHSATSRDGAGHMTVETVEPMGDSQNVHLLAGTEERMVARVAPDLSFTRDDKVAVAFAPEHVHLFAPDEAGTRVEPAAA